MPTYNIPRYKSHGQLDAGYKASPRVLDFNVDLASDVTMTTATDVIQLARLPEGAIIVGASIQQVEAGTGTGTLLAQIGSTALTGTLLATAAAGTVAATVPAAIATIVPVGGAEFSLLGATATRTTGKIRVVLLVVEGDRSPRKPGIVARDAIGG